MAGIDSLKIEGRVKSQYYVASIVSAYRRALDTFYEDMDAYMEKRDEFYEDTCKVSHHEYFTGFFLDEPGADGQEYGTAAYVRNWEVCAEVLRYDALRGLAYCEQRNKFFQGDELEALYPGGDRVTFEADRLLDEEFRPIASTPHAAMRFYVSVPKMLPKGSYLRRRTRN
jgi:putative protease